ADTEGTGAGVALPVGPGDLGRAQRVGDGEVGAGVREQAGLQVDRVSRQPVDDVRDAGDVERDRVGDADHGPREGPDTGLPVRYDLLAVARDGPVAVGVPALVRRVVGEEVDAGARRFVRVVRVDDLGALGEDVGAARLHREKDGDGTV